MCLSGRCERGVLGRGTVVAETPSSAGLAMTWHATAKYKLGNVGCLVRATMLPCVSCVP